MIKLRVSPEFYGVSTASTRDNNTLYIVERCRDKILFLKKVCSVFVCQSIIFHQLLYYVLSMKDKFISCFSTHQSMWGAAIEDKKKNANLIKKPHLEL